MWEKTKWNPETEVIRLSYWVYNCFGGFQTLVSVTGKLGLHPSPVLSAAQGLNSLGPCPLTFSWGQLLKRIQQENRGQDSPSLPGHWG